MHRQTRDEEFLWEVKSCGSYKNQTHMEKDFNMYALTMINTGHTRAGWTPHMAAPHAQAMAPGGRRRGEHNLAKFNVVSIVHFFL